jgi:glycosyltransferase involved in cell wall biosynthesis
MPKVLAMFLGKKRALGGCEIYRTTMPFYYLQAKHPHWTASWGFYEEMWLEAQKDIYYWNRIVKEYDIFVFPRVFFKDEKEAENFQQLVDNCHKANKRVVYEVDDDMTNEDRHVVDGDAISVAKTCDAITVTTPYLAQLMESRTGKKAYVLPNMVAPELWFEKPKPREWMADKLVIGLTGSATHKADWEVLKDVMPKIVENDKVHFLVMGYHPDYFDDLPNTSHFPGVDYSRYAHIIRSCDLILAPVNNDPFNLGKSSVKIIEGMGARRSVAPHNDGGAACLASNHPIYQPAIQHEKTGLLVDHTPEAWQSALERVIHDDPFRNSLQVNGHAWVQKTHDISKKSAMWGNAYSAILAKNTPV